MVPCGSHIYGLIIVCTNSDLDLGGLAQQNEFAWEANFMFYSPLSNLPSQPFELRLGGTCTAHMILQFFIQHLK